MLPSILDFLADKTVLFTVGAVIICLPFLFKSKSLKSLKSYIGARIRVHYFLKKRKRKFAVTADLRRTDLTPVDAGIVPSASEYELENPSKLLQEKNDGIHFVGISSDGQMIDLCINRIEQNMASVWIYLLSPEGHVYRSIDSDSRKAYLTSSGDVFSSCGLQIKCLCPLRKWRISFNGVLEKCKSEDEEDNKLVHTRFSFIWLAMSGVHEQNCSCEGSTLTDAFIREHHSPEEKDLIRLHELENRYEQWGQMMGTIVFKGEPEKECYFWSLRTRIADSPLWNEDITCRKCYMYFMEGTPLKIENLSIKHFISNLTCGFSITPYGAVKPISHCNWNMDELTKEVKFSCTINGDHKRIRLDFMEDVATTFYTGSQLQLKLDIRPFRVQMNDCDEGFGIAHRLSSIKDGRKPFQFPPLLLKDPGCSSESSFLPLEDELCRSSLVAGGKGSSLALLTQLAKHTDKFIVPRGFVISTTAFQKHLNANNVICEAIRRLKNVACTETKNEDLKAECNKCTSVFAASQLSQALKDEIRIAICKAYTSMENVRFSVRSSAFGEDSEDLSAAGQMLTVLGIRGIDNIFRAVIQCWASKFGFEAVQYARQNGQSLSSPMAVVVQEMVPSDYSGVLFTVDPVTGDPSHPYITANFGLGETVVSALADPDTIVLKRKRDQSLDVHIAHIGSKKTQVFMKTGDGVEEKKCENESDSSCLTSEWAVKIGEAGILIESCFCSPRDIEWAVHKNQLYLLQARPITTLHNETEFELIHDQDTPVRSVDEYWTRANTGEVFLGATSPLGIELVVGGMDLNAHRSHVLRDKRFDEYCPYFLHILPVTHRQIALNLVDTLFKTNSEEITPVQRAFEAALFGRAVLTEEIHQAGIKKYGYASQKQKYMGFLFIPLVAYVIPRNVAKLAKEIEEHHFTLDAYTSAKKTFDGVLDQMNFCSQVFGVHGMATFLSSYFNMMLMTILSKGKKEWDSELYCDFATMLSTCSGVESAEVPENLQELAKTIASYLGNEFSSLSVAAAHDRLKDETTLYGKLFTKFLKRHGHRCVKEFDLYTKSWGMQPESLIPTLQNIVKSPSILKTAPKEVPSTEDILSNLKTPLSSFNKNILRFLLPRSRKYVCQREKTKSMLIRTVDWLRQSCYHLGKLMVREGMLPDAELVFFLTLEEIKDILDSQKPGLVPKAIRRKRLHPQLNELKFPEIMKGIPKPIQVQQDLSSYASSFTLTGTPVCQGTVKGRAVVVLTLEEASKIESGDILITHATDIGWSPYFPLLSGVVTVLGGLISHGAVVAREFGLPCVVGVENATEAFKSGDTVILNGTKGTVTKILNEEKN